MYFPESTKIPENVSSLERSESYFELDKSVKKFPWGSDGLQAPPSLLVDLLLPVSHWHSPVFPLGYQIFKPVVQLR